MTSQIPRRNARSSLLPLLVGVSVIATSSAIIAGGILAGADAGAGLENVFEMNCVSVARNCLR